MSSWLVVVNYFDSKLDYLSANLKAKMLKISISTNEICTVMDITMFFFFLILFQQIIWMSAQLSQVLSHSERQDVQTGSEDKVETSRRGIKKLELVKNSDFTFERLRHLQLLSFTWQIISFFLWWLGKDKCLISPGKKIIKSLSKGTQSQIKALGFFSD